MLSQNATDARALFPQVRPGKRDIEFTVDFVNPKHQHSIITFRCDDTKDRNEWLEELHKAIQRRGMAGTAFLRAPLLKLPTPLCCMRCSLCGACPQLLACILPLTTGIRSAVCVILRRQGRRDAR